MNAACNLSVSLAAAALGRDYSIEITVRDIDALRTASALIPKGTRISITFLPGENYAGRVEAAAIVRSLGFVPVPHLSARRIASASELEQFLSALRSEAGIEDAFVIAGDLAEPLGPFEDALSIIRSDLLEKYQIRHVGIAGYPERHADIAAPLLDQALRDKHRELLERGFTCSVMTQFGFDAAPVLAWLARIRAEGVHSPVRIGVSGPASVKTLLRFAARCGVGASANVMRKYGVSITKLLSTAGPDLLIREIEEGLDPGTHGDVDLHFYPFGGLRQTAEWARSFYATAQGA